MLNPTLVLPSGESITQEEVLQGMLLLARHLTSYPVVTKQDAHLAILMLVPVALEFNDEHEII